MHDSFEARHPTKAASSRISTGSAFEALVAVRSVEPRISRFLEVLLAHFSASSRLRVENRCRSEAPARWRLLPVGKGPVLAWRQEPISRQPLATLKEALQELFEGVLFAFHPVRGNPLSQAWSITSSGSP